MKELFEPVDKTHVLCYEKDAQPQISSSFKRGKLITMTKFSLISLFIAMFSPREETLENIQLSKVLTFSSRVDKIHKRSLNESGTECWVDQTALNSIYGELMDQLLIPPLKECEMEKEEEHLSIICDFSESLLFDEIIPTCLENSGRIFYFKERNMCSSKSFQSIVEFKNFPWCLAPTCGLEWFIHRWENNVEAESKLYQCQNNLELS